MLPSDAATPLPRPVRSVLETLWAGGHEAYLVGGCVRGLLRGDSVRDFDVATSATPQVVLELLPRAVPIGLQHGTVMVPTAAGQVDVTTYRGAGGARGGAGGARAARGGASSGGGTTLEDDLAHRDFTLNAVALDVVSGRLIDPSGGLDDLAAGRLRAVGRAADRIAEDPLRALRAARFTASLAVTPDAELEAALAGAVPALARVARERIRDELARLLCGRAAPAGLALLRRSGIEAELAPGVASDAADVVGALPVQLVLRLAGWLRGTRAGSILARLRFSRRRVEEVERLLRLHPVEAQLREGSHAAVRRLLARAGISTLDALFALREAEHMAGSLAPEAAKRSREGLDRLRASIAELQRAGALALERQQLALDGEGVMRALGCGPGPQVGRALRYLTDQVLEEPSHNSAEGLRALLRDWSEGRTGRA